MHRGSATGTTSVTANWQTLTNTNTTTTAGNLLVAIVQYNGASAPPTPTGWTAIATASVSTSVSTAVYYIQNNGGGRSSETFAPSSSTSTVVQLAEFSGILTSGALDTSATNTLTPAGASVDVSATASTGPSLVIGAFGNDGNKSNQSFANAASPYTNIGSGDISGAVTHELGVYNAAAPSGTVTVTGASGNKDSQMAGVVAIFKVAVTTYYWRGGLTGCNTGTLYWDSTSCWATSSGGASSGATPGTADAVVFDGGGTGNCTLSSAASGTISVGSITIQSGYTGTITQSTQSLSLAGALSISGGTFVTGTSSLTLRTNQSGTYNGDLNVTGGTFTGGGATLAVRSLTVSSGSFNPGSSAFSTNNSGTATFSGTGASTFGGGTTSFVGLATMSGGTVTFGSGALTFSAGFTVSGGAVTMGTAVPSVTGDVTVSSGSLDFTNNASNNPDFTMANAFTQSGGTVRVNAAQVTFGTGVAAGNDGLSITGGTFDGGTGTLNVTGSSNSSGAMTTINGSGAVFSGGSGTQTFAGALNITSGAATLGTASMTSTRGGNAANQRADKLVTVSAGGSLTLSSSFTFNSTNTMTLAGTLNAAGTTRFMGPVTLTGTLNAGSATVNTDDVVTMTGTSAFNGGTGSGTFSGVPAFTAGTFTVGSSGSTGRWTFSSGASFALGMTLAFPNNGGELATISGQTISVAGTITSAVTGSTKPKIDCPTCTTNQGFAMTFTSTAVLNIDGLQFDHVATTGVTIANGATYTSFKNVKFTNNAAGGTSTGTHLAITSGNALLRLPGCYFDATAQYNVTLSGVTGSTGVKAILESQSTSTNGARAGEGTVSSSWDLDADTNDDGAADTTTTPRFGSVVMWVTASPSDTAGTAVGFPTAAFDWNTFSYYGIYVSYKNIAGAGTADVLWKRNNDGSAAYSYTIPLASGDLIGTPRWDTINETTASLDANGDGDQSDTNVHVVYLATTTGHIIKLIDNGTTLAMPASGPWSTEFTSSSIGTITSPLIADGVNLYFGGTDGTAAPKVFGVQIAAGANEKTLQKNIGALNPVTATPAWKAYGGLTYLFLGSTLVSSQAYVYRMNAGTGINEAIFSGPTANINDAIRLINDRAYAVTDNGKMYVLDAANFNSGGFTNLTGSPYSGVGGNAMKAAPYVDPYTNYAYLGDNAGRLYVVTATGGDLAGYPSTVLGSVQLSASPVYLPSGGIIAIGASDGYVYFVNRHNTSNVAAIHKRYMLTTSGSVSSIGYNYSTSQYMVSSSDGKLMFINGSDVTDPDATE